MATMQNPVSKAAAPEGLDLNTLMETLLIAVSPFIEAGNPGAGMGITQGVLGHQRARKEKLRQDMLSLAQIFSEADPDQIETLKGALKDQGWDSKAIESASRLGPIFADPSKRAQRALEKAFPSVFAAKALGIHGVLPSTGEVEAATAGGVPHPFQVESQSVVTGTRPVQRTEEGGLSRLLSPRQEPVVETQKRVRVRGVENSIPTLGELFPKAQGTPFANARILDKEGNLDLAEASLVAQRMGWITNAADQRAQIDRHQEFLRAKLRAHFAKTQEVNLPTLRAQMQDLNMVWGDEVRKAQKETKDTGEKPLLEPNQIASIHSQAWDDAARLVLGGRADPLAIGIAIAGGADPTQLLTQSGATPEQISQIEDRATALVGQRLRAAGYKLDPEVVKAVRMAKDRGIPWNEIAEALRNDGIIPELYYAIHKSAQVGVVSPGPRPGGR